jgi:hypothetical protein
MARVGVGASCIYPLLGCRVQPSWSFVGTDIDLDSIASSRLNVCNNGLEGSIELVRACWCVHISTYVCARLHVRACMRAGVLYIYVCVCARALVCMHSNWGVTIGLQNF